MKKIISSFLFLLFITLNSFSISAITITKIKKKVVYFNLRTIGEVAKGDVLYGINPKGKKKAIIKIKKVKWKRALGTFRGKLKKGWKLRKKKKKGAGLSGFLPVKKSKFWGIAANYNLNTFNTPFRTNPLILMSGSSLGAKAFLNYYFLKRAAFTTALHYLNFSNASQENLVCNTIEPCSYNVGYLSLDLGFIYAHPFDRSQIQIKLAGRFHYPFSKESTILDQDTIGSTISYSAELGYNWFLSRKLYLSATLEYNIFWAESDSDVNFISTGFGFGRKF